MPNKAQNEFKALMLTAGWSAAETSRRLGITKSAISQILSGRNTPTPILLDLLRHKVVDAAAEAGVPSDGMKEAPAKNYGGPYWGKSKAAPIISWASAGKAHAYEDQGSSGETLPTDCKDPNCYVLTVEGDSMEPKYQAGDHLVVSPMRQAQNGNLVVARTVDDSVYFKLLHISGREGETVRLTSYNSVYPVLEFRKKDFRFIHPVHSVTRKLIKGEG